jgi:beta-glucanase (GH16 family)
MLAIYNLSNSIPSIAEQGDIFDNLGTTGTLSTDHDNPSPIAGKKLNIYNHSNQADDKTTKVSTTLTTDNSRLTGNWVLKPVAGAIHISPNRIGSFMLWSNTTADVTTRSCLFDDIFRFNADGSFENIMGAETWLEEWQGGEAYEACGTPIAPHDGSVPATYNFNKSTGKHTINGTGAHIGISKAVNGGELDAGATATDQITYNVVALTDNTMTLDIYGSAWWRYQLVRAGTYQADTIAPVITLIDPVDPTIEKGSIYNPPRAIAIDNKDGDISSRIKLNNQVDTDNIGIYQVTYSVQDSSDNEAEEIVLMVHVTEVGTSEPNNFNILGDWILKPTANALREGPYRGGNRWWWTNSTAEVITKDCLFDDIFRLNADGSFANVLGGQTWLEEWQGVKKAHCGIPLAPHNGSTSATYSYNKTSGKLTIHGAGAYVGLPKVVNGGELDAEATVADSVTYNVVALTDNTMTVDINVGSGWWRYELVKKDDFTADVTAPVISVESADLTIEQGSFFTAPRATALDNADGDVSAKLVVDNQVDTDSVGTYKITYNVTDAAGNAADQIILSVDVIEQDAEKLNHWSIVGDWKLAHEAMALGVGPSRGSISWWSNTVDEINIRNCLFDDVFRFNADGSFANLLDDKTWIETWQGAKYNDCGAPVAPHDGSTPATYNYDKAAGTLTVYGHGAYLGLPKAVNGGEIPFGAPVANSIVYDVTALTNTTMILTIDVGFGWWRFKFARVGAHKVDTVAPVISVASTDITIDQGAYFTVPQATAVDNIDGDISSKIKVDNQVDTKAAGTYKIIYSVSDNYGNSATKVVVDVNVIDKNVASTSPLVGDWKMAPEAMALGVGSSQGDVSWWHNSIAHITTRSCFFDDIFRFNADGSFANIMGDQTWIESWQNGKPDDCDTPVAPHNGSVPATYQYDKTAGTITVNGAGAHIGLPKVINGGELLYNKAALVNSITYTVIELTHVRMTLDIKIGVGWWRYRLVKDGVYTADTTAPIIKLVNSAPTTIARGSVFNPPQATAMDNIDGDISANISIDNQVDTDNVGIYQVTYAVKDSAGNAASEVALIIHVTEAGADKNNSDFTSKIHGDWVLKPAVNALVVGPNRGDANIWWSNNLHDMDNKNCLFDDIFRFNADGSFENIMGEETWVESWQNGKPDDCAVPVAPHDGSNHSIYSYDPKTSILTVFGSGAHIGLAKVVNGGELSRGATVAKSITYNVVSLTDTSMTLDINIGIGWWRFELVKKDTYTIAPSDLGDPIDFTKWHQQSLIPNGKSWYNGEQQHYTDRNTYISDGTLKIVAKKEPFTQQGVTKQYTSSRLNSKFAFTYGRVEVRAKLPTGYGTWPAIWLLGKNINERGAYWQTQGFGTAGWPECGEVDLMEHWGANQNWILSAIHTPSSFGDTLNKSGQSMPTASSEFHVYSLDWTENWMIFSVDGKIHYIYNPEVKNAETWPFDSELYLLINVAIESRISSNFQESQMEVDYVRIYAPNSGPDDAPIWSDEFD